MDINLSIRKCPKLILLVSILFVTNISNAQYGLNIPDYSVESPSDSAGVSFSRPVLPLRNWFDHTDQFFELKHESNNLDIYQYISPSNIYPKDPFKVDLRGTSYYVPRMVRDELNLIMNRPKDNSFVPILPVAFLALQLASKYVLIQMKTEISWENAENGKEGLPILEELWQKKPQTISELYKREKLKDSFTMMEIKRLIDILIDNKLVKRKLIENSETQYFYALEKIQYLQLIEKGHAEKINSHPKTIAPALEMSPQIK